MLLLLLFVRAVTLMALNLASLNVRGLRDLSKCAHLLGEHLNLCMNVAVVQETHFTCTEDCWVLEGNIVVCSVFSSRWISIMYHNYQVVVQMNRKIRGIHDRAVDPAGLPCFLLSMS